MNYDTMSTPLPSQVIDQNYPRLLDASSDAAGAQTGAARRTTGEQAHEPVPLQTDVEALRLQLQLGWFAKPDVRALALLQMEEESPPLGAPLAQSFTEFGQRTLLIDTQLVESGNDVQSRHSWQQLPGLAQVLAGEVELEVALQFSHQGRLATLPAGRPAHGVARLLTQDALRAILDEAADSFDVILLTAPARGRFLEASIVASAAGGALVLLRRHRTLARSLSRMATALSAAHVPVAGAVFVE